MPLPICEDIKSAATAGEGEFWFPVMSIHKLLYLIDFLFIVSTIYQQCFRQPVSRRVFSAQLKPIELPVQWDRQWPSTTTVKVNGIVNYIYVFLKDNCDYFRCSRILYLIMNNNNTCRLIRGRGTLKSPVDQLLWETQIITYIVPWLPL